MLVALALLIVLFLIISPLVLLYLIIVACASRIRMVLIYAIAMVAVVFGGYAVEPLISNEAKARVASLPQAPEPKGAKVAIPFSRFIILIKRIEIPCGNNALGLCENGVQQIEIND